VVSLYLAIGFRTYFLLRISSLKFPPKVSSRTFLPDYPSTPGPVTCMCLDSLHVLISVELSFPCWTAHRAMPFLQASLSSAASRASSHVSFNPRRSSRMVSGQFLSVFLSPFFTPESSSSIDWLFYSCSLWSHDPTTSVFSF